MDRQSENIELSENAFLWLQNQNNKEKADNLWQGLSAMEKVLLNSVKENSEFMQREIEELKDKNIAIKNHLAFYKAAMKQVDTPVFIKDEEARYCVVNDSFLDFCKITEQDIIGNKVNSLEILTDAEKQKTNERDQELLENLSSVNKEVTFSLKEDKQRFWFNGTGFQDSLGRKGIVGILSDVSSLMAQNDELSTQLDELFSEKKQFEMLAITDPLTGLYNKLSMNIHMQRLIRGNELYNTNFSVLMFDIDHFKQVNDNYGHLEGDEVLRKTGKLILETSRKVDICIRYGGEEFLILLPGTSLNNAKIFAQRLCYILPKKVVKSDDSSVTISIGVTEYVKDESVEDLIKRADSYLYSAKKNGRNQVMGGN